MQQSTIQSSRPSQFLRGSLTFLILGVGALCLTASPALATQVFVSNTQTSFTVMEQKGPLNGVDDKVYTEFDFSGVDWNTVTLNSAILELHITYTNGAINSDEILFGDTLNVGATDLDSSILGGVDLFDQTTVPNAIKNPLTFGLPVPGVGAHSYTLDLGLFYDYGDLQTALLGGDSIGKIYMKYSDDATPTYAKLTLGYDQVLVDPETNCINECGPSTNPVPEPSTMILLGSGLIGLVAWRKRHHS